MMDNKDDPVPLPLKRVRNAEIAHVAGVGLATVDRVLHGRTHVRDETRQRVLQAKAALESGATVSQQRRRPWRLKVFLPEEAGPSTEFLAQCFQDSGKKGNVTVECVFTTKMQPATLARKLRACEGQGIDGVAFQALEDARVADAVAHLGGRKIPCISLMSPLASDAIRGYIGTDGRAAGRTAALLASMLWPHQGTVGVISGGQLYRSHEDREMGFRAYLLRSSPQLDLPGALSGGDSIEGNCRVTLDLLDRYPDLLGIYNVGGGNEGIVRALRQRDVAGEVKLIGHNLTPKTQQYLIDDSMQFVIHQNMRHAADDAVAALIAELENRSAAYPVQPVEIITRENIHGAVFG